MKLSIRSIENKEVGSVQTPIQFDEPLRTDIIKRAFDAIMANSRQPYGVDPRAGKKVSAQLSKRRRDFKGCYGKGISRVPRKTMSRNGTQFSWVGAFAPGTVGGRKAHPPLAIKIWTQKVNDKERRKAIRSALGATLMKEVVASRGHKAPEQYPFAIDNTVEEFTKAKQLFDMLEKLGFVEELERAGRKEIRAGRGKMRGRRYKRHVGPLIVVSGECKLLKSGNNVPGVDIVSVNALSADVLAPGAAPGRLTIFTQSAIQKLAKENLYL